MFLVLAILLLSFFSSRGTIIIPFRPIREGKSLTITCIVTNGPGAGSLSLEDETANAYLPTVVVHPNDNTHAGRFNYGPVSRIDNGRKFVCRNNFDDSKSVTEVLEVVSKHTPTVPRGLSFSNTQPFSSTVSWSAPEDNGGDLNPPTYRINVTLSNGSKMMYTSTDLMLQLTNLWHSLKYTVSVVAVNKYGTSPPAERVLTTPDSVPIIYFASVRALSLSKLEVSITLLTDGGQSVEYYEVSRSPRSVIQHVSSENASTVSFVIWSRELGILDKGFYGFDVQAKNGVGKSESYWPALYLPSLPNITSPPTPLEPSVIATCCAGVKLNLVDPNGVRNHFRVKVYRSGVLHPSTLHEGDYLTISGLQAGREYSFRVSVVNSIGMSEANVTLTPLLGQPSNPVLSNVTVNGTEVTVVLSTAYPGTEGTRSGNNFRFELQFINGGSSTHQSTSRMQPFTPSNLTTPVNTTYSTTLDSGTYTVRVTAVNEHGSSESVMSEVFVVTAPPTNSTENTPLIVGVVGEMIAVVLVIVPTFIVFICTIRALAMCIKLVLPNKETNGGNDAKQGVTAYDDSEVEAKSDSDIKTIELESNPSYQPMTIEPSVTDPTYEEMETKLQMTDNPAYGSAQTNARTDSCYSNL